MVPVSVDWIRSELRKLSVELTIIAVRIFKNRAPLLLNVVQIFEVVHADNIFSDILVSGELGNF